MEFLTTINEGDEHVSLGDVLALRDSCLSESELWAVCRECCLALQGIHLSSDIFQTLCITPDAMCFDQGGTVCFLDLYIDPEPMYVPPEYEKMGNSYKSHLYSLGMTLLFAAEYNVSMAGTRQFSTELGYTINKMTLDDLETRASLEYVLEMCSKYLGEEASDGICQQIVSVAQSDTSFEDDRLSSDIDQLLPLDSDNPDTTTQSPLKEDTTSTNNHHLPHHNANNKRSFFSSRKRASPVDLIDPDNLDAAAFNDTGLEFGGSVDPFSRRTLSSQHSDSHVTLPAKVKRTVGFKDTMKKRDPLAKILRTTFVEEEDDFKGGEEFFENEADVTGATSVEDITLLVPPVSNDLDLLQWDSDFLLSSYSSILPPAGVSTGDGGNAYGWSGENEREEFSGGGQDDDGTKEKLENPTEGWGNKVNEGNSEDTEGISSTVELNEVEVCLEEEDEEGGERTEFFTTENVFADPTRVKEDHTLLQTTEEGESRGGSNKSQENVNKDIQGGDRAESQTPPVITEGGQSVLRNPSGIAELACIESGNTEPKHSISDQEDFKASSTTNKDITCELLSPHHKDQSTEKDKGEEGSITSVVVIEGNGLEELEDLKSQVEEVASEKGSKKSGGIDDKESTDQGSSLLNSSSSLSISQGSEECSPHTMTSSSSATTPTFQVSSGDTTLDLSQSEGSWGETPQTHEEAVYINNNTNTVTTTTTEPISGMRTISIEQKGSSINSSSSQPHTTTTTQTPPTPSEEEKQPACCDWSCPLESGNRRDNPNTWHRESLGEKEEEGHSSVQNNHISESNKSGNNLGEEGTEHKDIEEGGSSRDVDSTQDTTGTLVCTTTETDTSVNSTKDSEEVVGEKETEEEPALPPTTSAEVVTIKFNAVFGKRIHRDTSRDTLNQDIQDSGSGDALSSAAEISIKEGSVLTAGHVVISGDLNAQDGGSAVVDSSKAVDSMEKSGGSSRQERAPVGSSEGQSVLEILDRLGCGFHENEVWALCRECVLAMQRNRLHLPAYVSLETVALEDTGRVTYRPVPEDKELEVVFLAPELQKFGVITEKTCLFGVAAMLWSAADYRLPANQEPALSEELENLLISMTQDDNDLRPTAIEVLQTCNEFQKKQTTTSTQICQALVTDAKKALDYGKGNTLVKDILDQQIENEVKSHKAEVVKVIQGQPAVTLKPASERTERPQVETEPTLHEKLMALIRVPPRRLRRSSKPRIQTVTEIYRHNPELIETLTRVTGVNQEKQTDLVPPTSSASSAHTAAASSSGDSSVTTTTSAFLSVGNGVSTTVTDSTTTTASSTSVPEAYNSKATHFTPIILSGDQEKSGKKSEKIQSPPVTKGSKSNIDEKEMAEKIKKLKKNLMKNRLPLTLAADLESEVMQDKPRRKSVTPTSTSHQSQPVVGQGHMRLPTPPNIYIASPPSVLGEGYNPVLTSVTPTAVHAPAGYMPTSPSPQFQGHFFPPTLQQTQLMSTSVPNLAYQYAPMAFQMGFQQDPRTGLFQLVPVPTPMPISGMPVQPGMHSTASMGQINLTPPMQNTGHITVTPPGGTQQQRHSPLEKQVSTPSGSSTDGERPERKRHRKRQHKVKERSKHDTGSRSSQTTKSRTHSDSSSRVSNKSQASSRKDDSDRELDGHYGNKGSDLSPVLERRAPVPRASSVDLLVKYENGNNAQPRTPRTVKMRDQRNKIKRTKSGSSVDFKNNSNSELKPFEIYDDSKVDDCQKLSCNISRSQPNLESELIEFTPDIIHVSHHSKVTKPRSQRRKTDPASPELPSPPLSPSLSKDSGVSGMNVKTSDMSLMERLLNSDTIRHQQRLSRVVRIVREEFAYDGYMENGIEDLAMAEYVLSLGNLKWETFYSAVTEKYCDLYFEEDIVSALFEAVNGKRPLTHRRTSPISQKLTRGDARVVNGNKPHQDTGTTQPRTQDTYTAELAHNSNSPSSAFRPIQNGDHKLTHTPPSQGQPEVIVKPKPTKVQTQGFPALAPRQTGGVQNPNKTRSSSLRDLVGEDDSITVNESSRTLWHSDEDVLEHENDSANISAADLLLMKKHDNKPPTSENSMEAEPINGMATNNQKTDSSSESSPTNVNMDLKHMSKLSYLVRQDSEASERRKASLRRRINVNGRSMLQSKSALEVRPSQLSPAVVGGRGSESPLISISQISTSVHTDLRDEAALSKLPTTTTGDRSSATSSSGGNQVRRNMYESETQLSLPIDGGEGQYREERVAVPKPYADMSRLGRGSVVYYSAEMQNRLRPDVKDFAAQIDTKTKESIEAKMAELEQQMMMEHKNKKKTLKYYRKLVETTKVGKITTDQRALLTRVGEQVTESNDRLDFLDAAKKHLEMLHSEQWGLDRTLLYALANCPGDTAMLLCACDNPLLQYQLLRSPRLGIEGQILQAGSPQGLMSYLFAQAALSEGFIHQFFYCYRYFTTPQHLYNFLSEKFTAAALSLSPGADIPSKVKARAMDLMQVWIEGFYIVDLKDSPLMEDFSTFIQEKVMVVDDSAELIVEVIESCKDGRHRDLYYSEFCAREDTNNNNTMEEMPVRKWESFKAAFTGKSPKPKVLAGPVVTKDGVKRSGVEGIRRSDSFNLMDYTAQNLAEQLTLLEQVLFIQSHPVHYLNSKYLGVSVALTNQILHKADSTQRLSGSLSIGESSNLFVGEAVNCTIIQSLIEHAQNIAFWVTGEIVSCANSKSQAAVLSKFIYIAKYCQEARNFATCVSIVDGLENLIVRQLPVWKILPSKCVTAMGELSSLKMLLKSDSLCLLQDETKRHCPTIPSVLYFLLHVQQLEIGGFTLANKMFRWTKIKSIASMIDQIRLFQQNQYLYSVDVDLQQALKTRMSALSTQDLPTLAQHATNIPKAPSAGKLSLAFKKMSRKMKGGPE